MRKVSLVLLMAILMLALTSSAFAVLNQFRGHWKNIDPNTSGVTTLNIDVRGNLVTIRAWGKCHPQDCDWGRVAAHAYAPSVSSNLQATARALSAIFRTSFSQTLMVIHPQRQTKRLQAEIMTHFTDNSGRTDYNAVYIFEKTVLVLIPIQLLLEISKDDGKSWMVITGCSTLVKKSLRQEKLWQS